MKLNQIAFKEIKEVANDKTAAELYDMIYDSLVEDYPNADDEDINEKAEWLLFRRIL